MLAPSSTSRPFQTLSRGLRTPGSLLRQTGWRRADATEISRLISRRMLLLSKGHVLTPGLARPLSPAAGSRRMSRAL